jgi:[ribosomal protein S18]-alanine N-acetyltransferase
VKPALPSRTPSGLAINQLSPEWQKPLAEFFRLLEQAGDTKRFHPHPMTASMARELTRYSGQDLYYVLVEAGRVLGYGLLRGWDEGYEVPSLGLAIVPEARGCGTGKTLMHFLHAAARRKGARRVRLKVYPENQPALALYRGMGYRFEGPEDGQLVGYVDLAPAPNHGQQVARL